MSEVRALAASSKWLPAVFAATLAASVVLSPGRAIWDEHWYLENCRALLDTGFTTTYLRGFHVSTGPLFALIHAVPFWLSNGSVHAARIVNLLFWALSTALIYAFAQRIRGDDARMASLM